MDLEIAIRSGIYLLGALLLLAGAFWWGWDSRTRLALKLEYFRLTNQRWVDYDQQLKRGELKPRATLHDIRESRESDR